MKLSTVMFRLALLGSSLFFTDVLAAQVSVNQDNSAPDPSAMLDVKSSDKGMLVPRMTTAQRTAISNPATGLLVFDSDTESFWFRESGGWAELKTGNPSVLEDADGDTQVQVESSPDEDKIRFNLEGLERLRLENNKLLLFNNIFGAGSNLHFEFNEGNKYNRITGIIPGNFPPPTPSGYKLNFNLNGNNTLSLDGAGGVTVNNSYSFPTADGTAGQVLTTNGSGATSWSLPINHWALSGNDIYNANSGNVGIGKSQPTAPLHVYRGAGEHAIVHIEAAGSTSDARLELSKLGGVASAGIGYYPGNGFLRLRTNSSNHIVFEPNGLEAMRIKDGGNVGIGTDNPGSKLDIRGDGKTMVLQANTAGSSSYVEMSNAGSGLIGRIGADGAGFSGTNGLFSLGTWTNSDIGFFTNQTERMRILSNGKVKVGQGTTFGGGVFSARNDADNVPVATIWNNGYDPDNTDNPKHDGLYIRAGRDQNNNANSLFLLFERPDATTIGAVRQTNANNISYDNTSDIRLKTNIQPTRFSVADLMKIAVRDYEYKDEPGEVFTGYLAQQLNEVFPNAVTPGGRDAKTDPWMVDYSKLTPLLTKAVQDQQATIEAQQKRIAELEAQVARIDQLESVLLQMQQRLNNEKSEAAIK
ncbi:MAG: tail fiber domain-containing protein [Lewinellaceae bacterium]|nr:tail fiber domain-containing protein [Lewinellaceae bacterium]